MSQTSPNTVRKEAVAIEATLADVRIVLWLATAAVTATTWILTGKMNTWQMQVLGIFLAYSLSMRIAIRRCPRYFRQATFVSSIVEVMLITGLISAASLSDSWAGSSRSPFYLWYVFYVASISLRYGMQMSILGLAASVMFYTSVSMSPIGLRFGSPGFMGDTGFLFILAFLFGHIAERQKSYQTRLAVVNELGVALASLGTSREIAQLMVTQTASLVDSDMCWFAPSKDDEDTDTTPVAHGLDPGDKSDFLGEFAPDSVLGMRRVLVSNKPRKDQRIPSEALKLLHIKSLAAVPLYVRDEPVGVLYAANKQPRGFTGYDVDLLELIAAQAAPIIENTQLWERLKEAAASEERLRIARDLHDNFLQTLSAIKLYLERCRILVDKDPQRAKASIERIHEISTEGLADVRSYLSQLRLMGPDPSKFDQAATQCATEAAARGGFVAHTDIDAPEELLTQRLALTAFQILRELLNNVVKHAEATNVWVKVGQEQGSLLVTVRDDGAGFDIEVGKRASDRGHLGLVGIGERVQEFDGEFEITSCPGEGTKAKVLLPFSKTDSSGRN